jgi:hypothetical protein
MRPWNPPCLRSEWARLYAGKQQCSRSRLRQGPSLWISAMMGCRMLSSLSVAITRETSAIASSWVSTRRTLRRGPCVGVEFSKKKHDGLAADLMRSAQIGNSGYFGKYGLMARRAGTASTTATQIGNWGSGQPNRFPGVKFLIHGTTHFGWIRMTVKNPKTRGVPTAPITEYGYETTANQKVLAGLPSNNTQAPEG